MVAYSHALDVRTNFSAGTHVFPILQEPRERTIHRINWFEWHSDAESGSFAVGDNHYLVEGPLPGDGQQVGLAQNFARDNQDFKAIVTQHPTGSTATADMATAPTNVGHVVFPGGIWTVERMFVGISTAGGVERITFTIGYEKIKVSKAAWLDLVHASPNSRDATQLVQ